MENKWLRRPDEWIKENPGKPYMYKEKHSNGVPENTVKFSSFYPRQKYVDRFAGVYVVLCNKSSCAYVGQSKNVHTRLRSHKMAMQSTQAKGSVYIKMRQDLMKYGIDSFSFVFHKKCDNNVEVLLKEEALAMMHYVKEGYSLYNKVISVSPESIYCPQEHQLLISNIVDKICNDKNYLDALYSFINSVPK